MWVLILEPLMRMEVLKFHKISKIISSISYYMATTEEIDNFGFHKLFFKIMGAVN